jgi:hypothetical protein
VSIVAALKCNHQIELAASRLANTRRDHARAIFIFRQPTLPSCGCAGKY